MVGDELLLRRDLQDTVSVVKGTRHAFESLQEQKSVEGDSTSGVGIMNGLL